MQLNMVGLAAAAATFLGVWIGHVSVRSIERTVERLWIPSLIALVSGTGLQLLSLGIENRAGSAFCGILGVTLLWDALEFHRQHRRVMEGRAPANRRNPRHARILAACPNATTIDWLDRDPAEDPVSMEDLPAAREKIG